MKKILSLILFNILLYGNYIVVATQNIGYKQKVTPNNTIQIPSEKKLRCKSIDIQDLQTANYIAKHYIIKGKPICKKDIKIAKTNIVSIDFGNIVIQKEGEIISQTKKYIKIKRPDGKIEKIYLNGQF